MTLLRPNDTSPRKRQRPERLECAWCGRAFLVSSTGRIPLWCSTSCRHRAWEQRRAAASGLAAVEVRERVVEVVAPASVTASMPKGRAWVDALQELAKQLDSGRVYDKDLPAIRDRLTLVIASYERRIRFRR